MLYKMKSLLIISCSWRKNGASGKMPAIKRYEGVSYRIISRLKKEHRFPANLDIVIISGKYGFLRPNDLIEYYDLRMDEERARMLNEPIVKGIREYMRGKRYREIFVNLGRNYLLSIKGFEQFVPEGAKIIAAEGRASERMRQMKSWILGLK